MPAIQTTTRHGTHTAWGVIEGKSKRGLFQEASKLSDIQKHAFQRGLECGRTNQRECPGVRPTSICARGHSSHSRIQTWPEKGRRQELGWWGIQVRLHSTERNAKVMCPAHLPTIQTCFLVHDPIANKLSTCEQNARSIHTGQRQAYQPMQKQLANVSIQHLCAGQFMETVPTFS